MAFFKITMLFELRTNLTGQSVGARIGGWSESVYRSDLPSGTVLQNLQTNRARFLPQGARIVGQRVQQVFPVGNSRTSGNTFNGAWNGGSDIPAMGLLVSQRASGSNNVRRSIFRGIPDDIVSQGEYRPQGNFEALVNGYMSYLQGGGYGFPGRDLTIRPTPIETISTGGIVTLSAPFTAQSGDKLAIRDVFVNAYSTISDTFTVQKVNTSTEVVINGWPSVLGVGGTAINQSLKTFIPFGSDYAINRVVTRKVGRPFGGYRGRASARR